MILTHNGKKLRYFDKDAINFIDAAGLNDDANINGEGNYTGKEARLYVDAIVKAFKSCGAWDGTKAIYPFVGGNTSQHMLNLKDPRDDDSAFRMTFSGGLTHDKYGMTGNGINGIANTHLKANSFSDSSYHLSFYGDRTKTDANDSRCMGANKDLSQMCIAFHRLNSFSTLASLSNNVSFTLSSIIKQTSYLIGNVLSGNTGQYNDGVFQASSSNYAINSLATNDNNINILSTGGSTFSTQTTRFASIGNGLTSQQAIYLSHHIRVAQAILKRQ